MDIKDLKPIFDYLDEKFLENKQQVVAEIEVSIKANLNTLQSSVDGLAKSVKDFQDEHIVLHKRVETLEKWAEIVSKKVGVPIAN